MKFTIFAFITLAAFSFQIMDIPPAANHRNSKTCCGRSICSCKHAPGALCPFKHKIKDAALQANKQVTPQKHCHLPVKEQAQKLTDSSAAPQPSFTKAPCHSDAPKTTATAGYYRDFNLSSDNFLERIPTKNHFALQNFYPPNTFYSKGIDHPPKLPISI